MGAFASIETLCEKLNAFGKAPFTCAQVADTCSLDTSTVFTGATIELASPQNVKIWNGRGGAGHEFALIGVCGLRDLGRPGTGATANLSTLLGDISFEQSFGQLRFKPGPTPSLRAYQRGRLCAPVLGCLSAITQEFEASMADEPVPAGRFAGQYEIRRLHGVKLLSDRLLQGMDLRGPVFPVPAGPLGTLGAQPVVEFHRRMVPVGAPFRDGNVQSALTVGVWPAAQETDVRTLDEGLTAIALKPIQGYTGWIGQLGLGGRAALHKDSLWTVPSPAQVPWPTTRPDASLAMARNAEEVNPNLRAEARLEIVYDLLDKWPPGKALADSGLLTHESLLQLTIKPALEVAASMQTNLWNAETAAWTSLGEFPPPAPQLGDLDQFRRLEIYGGTSIGGGFHVDVGLDLVLTLDLLWKVDLLDFHDHVRAFDAEAKSGVRTREWAQHEVVEAEAKRILQGQAFTKYHPLFTPKLPFDGKAQLQACIRADPLAATPPGIEWTPGDPKVLATELHVDCNVCIAWEGGTRLNKAGKKVTYPGFGPAVILPASQGSKDVSLRWLCDATAKTGCHDVCKIEPDRLVLIKTAIELEGHGGRTGCDAKPRVEIH